MISGLYESPKGIGDLAYFGLTKRDAVERLEEHLYKFDQDKHPNEVMQGYYNQWGRGCMTTGVVISCPQYYLNSLEKYYIADLSSYTGVNPFGWNKSKGGEGAKRYCEPFALTNGEYVHYSNELYPFLIQNKNLEPENVLKVLDGSLGEYKGWRLQK